MRTAEEEQTCGKGLAERLEVKAREMAGHRDLPMGRHNMEAMAGSKRLTPFERYVRVKRELLGLVQATPSQDEAMLPMMRGRRDEG